MALPLIPLAAAAIGVGGGAYVGYKTASTAQKVTSVAGIAALIFIGYKLSMGVR